VRPCVPPVGLEPTLKRF